MNTTQQFNDLVKDINLILEDIQGETKTLKLCKQRGYLTGWLARLASKDHFLREEIKHKKSKIKK